MDVNLLAKLVPVPSGARRTEFNWTQVEAEIGVLLPTSYKDVCRVFGAGTFFKFINVFDPWTPNRHMNLCVQWGIRRKALIESGWPTPLYVFPPVGGLLTVGSTDNGDFLCMETGGSEVVWLGEARGPSWERFEMDLCEFLVRCVEGRLDSELVQLELPSPTFDSAVS